MTVAQRSSAEATLDRKGQTVTLSRQTSGGYNPSTGSSTVTPSTQTAHAVILPLPQGIRSIPGSEVMATDRWCILSALSASGVALTAPKVNDTLTDANGDGWRVVEVSPLTPAGLDIMYELIIRGSGA